MTITGQMHSAMTAPHNGYASDNISYTAEQDNLSPAISVSSSPETWRRNATNHRPAKQQAAYDRGVSPAYATKPSPDTTFTSFLPYDRGQPTIAGTETLSHQQQYRSRSTGPDQSEHRNLVLASVGLQPWVAPAGPYVDFGPLPSYESTAELTHEHVQSFDQFDHSPVVPVQSAATALPKSVTPTSTPGTVGNPSTEPSSVNTFAQPTLPRSALKRKADSVESPISEPPEFKKPSVSNVPSKQRSVSFERMSSNRPKSPGEASSSSDNPPGPRSTSTSTVPVNTRRGRQQTNPVSNVASSTPITAPATSVRFPRGTKPPDGHPPPILPPEKVFPIQIGSELFRLSGASISSDAPSYFTQFFEDQIRQNEESGGVRTLYIDRDPITFRDVARHLQGYHVKPTDGSHFVKLFADAQFYSLPRLIHQLFESEIFIQIGEKHFQIPKDIFSEPGNSPNFFSLGFAVFFSTPGDVFPGLDRRGLLRPPSITPPYVPGRSAEIFAELLHLLRGYPLHIKNDSHRAALLRDCRYFHLRGLEQRIIAHEISYNLQRQKYEICLRLEDIKPSGVSFTKDEGSAPENPTGGWVSYARPFVDEKSYELIVEIGGENTNLNIHDMRVDFHNLTKARISSLFQVIANKMNLPTNAPLGLIMLSGGQSRSASPGQTPLSEDRVKVRFEPTTAITLDGMPYEIDWESPLGLIMANGPATDSVDFDPDSEVMSDTAAPKSAQTGRADVQQSQLHSAHSSDQVRQGMNRLQASQPSHDAHVSKKRKFQGSQDGHDEWIIRTGQWRLRVQPNPQDRIRGGFEIVFIPVKIDAFSSEQARNVHRVFLT